MKFGFFVSQKDAKQGYEVTMQDDTIRCLHQLLMTDESAIFELQLVISLDNLGVSQCN